MAEEKQAELARKLQALRDNKIPSGDIDSVIWQLGKAEYLPARPVIERFLTHTDDDIRIAALKVLVNRFGARERKYWELARDLLTDNSSWNRLDGTSVLGILKRNTQDEETLRLLAPMVSNQQEGITVRRAAYGAMHEIIHFDPFEVGRITIFPDFNLEQEADWELIKKYQSST